MAVLGRHFYNLTAVHYRTSVISNVCLCVCVCLLERHPITNAIDGTNQWWQSPSIKNGRQFHWITITLDLKQVTHLNTHAHLSSPLVLRQHLFTLNKCRPLCSLKSEYRWSCCIYVLAGDYNTGTCLITHVTWVLWVPKCIFLLRFFKLPTSSSRLPTLHAQVRLTSFYLSVIHIHSITAVTSHSTTQPVWITDLSVSQVTGSWSALWTVSPLTRGNFMPSVILSVWHVTTSRRGLDLRPTRATQRSSVHLTIPDWTHWSMERWGSLPVWAWRQETVWLTVHLSVWLNWTLNETNCHVSLPVLSLPLWPDFMSLVCLSDPHISD